MAKCHEIAEFFYELSTNPWEPKKQTRPEMQKPDEQKNELVFFVSSPTGLLHFWASKLYIQGLQVQLVCTMVTYEARALPPSHHGWINTVFWGLIALFGPIIIVGIFALSNIWAIYVQSTIEEELSTQIFMWLVCG